MAEFSTGLFGQAQHLPYGALTHWGARTKGGHPEMSCFKISNRNYSLVFDDFAKKWNPSIDMNSISRGTGRGKFF
jgi:hypothetical protein